MSIEQWLSPLGIVSVTLFVGGVCLIVWNFFRRELTFEQKRRIVEDRESYIPLFRDTVDKMLTRLRELVVEAGLLSLEQYYDKYLKLNNTYENEYRKLHLKDVEARRKLAIILALYKKGFWIRSTYLYELEDRDELGMVSLKKVYATYLARVNDRSLSSDLKQLFRQASKFYSCLSLSEVVKNNELPFKDPKYINVFYEKPKILESLLNYLHKAANSRFDELLRGDDL